ncbi:hypothetical protein CEXT_102251 [Caerostris extrusa]|uniref:Uncharacterized protein n=1 Tax=Caerostris extrusa TaxID=172846 RepID=A0AAV4NU93_CAEEX|nr:hypothetical protein CEXT_102251 [Caerostris extrusa]
MFPTSGMDRCSYNFACCDKGWSIPSLSLGVGRRITLRRAEREPASYSFGKDLFQRRGGSFETYVLVAQEKWALASMQEDTDSIPLVACSTITDLKRLD